MMAVNRKLPILVALLTVLAWGPGAAVWAAAPAAPGQLAKLPKSSPGAAKKRPASG